MNAKWIFVLSMVSVLCACSKGGGGANSIQERPSGDVKGTAFDGLIHNGEVTVTTLDGAVIGSTTTDENGLYTITLNAVTSQPLRLEISSGTYKEEFSGESAALRDGKKMKTLINYVQGESVNTSITYFTTIATGYAEYQISNGADPKTAIDNANNAVAQLIDIDILSVTPVDITDELQVTPSLTEGQRYGYFTAAISAYTAWVSSANNLDMHDVYNSIAFAQLAYDDIKYDGKLDGIDGDGVVAMGKIQFSVDTYRYTLALNMLVMANNENNKLGYTAEDLIGDAKKLNESASPIFSDAAIIPLNADGTIISSPSWIETDVFYGNAKISVSAIDVVGVTSATLTINGITFTTDNFEKPTFTFDTTQFEDGTYEAVVKVTNATNVITEFTQNITFANRATTVVSTDPIDGQAVSGKYDFRAVVADPFGIDQVRFIFDDSITLEPASVTDPSVTVDTKSTLGSEGEHKMTVRAVGLSGFEAVKEISFIVDNTAPTATTNLTSGTYVTSAYTLKGEFNDNLAVKSASIMIDGAEIYKASAKGTYSVSFDPLTFTEGTHTLSIDVYDQANNKTTVQSSFLIDRNPPTVNITNASGAVVTTKTTIKFDASDTLGFGTQKIVANLEGYPIPLATLDNTARSFELDPSTLFWGEGNSTISVAVTDGSGKVSTDSIVVNFQHIPTSLALGTTSTDSVGFRTQNVAISWASGIQTINYLRFNNVDMTSTSFNDVLTTWSSPKNLADGTSTFSLIHWGLGGSKTTKCDAVVGTLSYSITDAYGVVGSGSINNFTWCPTSEYSTSLMWSVSNSGNWGAL